MFAYHVNSEITYALFTNGISIGKAPFFLGPYCDNDPQGWAFGRVALIDHCGSTCGEIESLCNDDPSISFGPEWLYQEFPDCCFGYEPTYWHYHHVVATQSHFCPCIIREKQKTLTSYRTVWSLCMSCPHLL